MDVNLNVKARIQNILAHEALCPGRLDRVPNNARGLGKLAPDVNVAKVRIRRVSRNGQPLDELMRVVVKNIAVLESSGLGLVGVDHDIVRLAIIVFDEAPFGAAGKSRAAAAAQIGGFDDVHDLRRLHCHCLAERFITAMSETGLDRGIVARLADILEDDPPLLGMRRRHDKGFPAHWYRSKMSETASGEILSCSSLLIKATGALPQLARHSTNSTLNLPSGVVGGALP